MKRIIFLLLCGIFPLFAIAQSSRPVRGVVFDADGVPMAGATLAAVGSNEMGVSKVDGTFEMMVSPYTKYIKATKEGFVSVQAEVDGSYLVFKLLVDKKYLENKAKAEEAARLAAEAKTKAEEEARLAEEKRLAAEKAAAEKAEQERIAAEARARLAEEKRIAAEKLAAEKAEAARLAAEEKARIAEEKRIAAEKAAEEKRIAAEKIAAEKARLAEEKRRLEEEKRLAAEKAAAEKAERERLAAEERARIAAEQARLAEMYQSRQVASGQNGLNSAEIMRAEAERKAALEQAERERIAEEKRLAAERAAAEKQARAEARIAAAKPWKEAKLKGYRSYVEASFAIDYNLMPAYAIHYIGGYQINNFAYIGVGAGLNIDGNESRADKQLENKELTTTMKTADEDLALNMLNVPIFLHLRVNFMDSRCTPFFALSAGYRWSTNRKLVMPFQRDIYYATSGLFATPQIGVDFRVNKRSSVYLSAGFNVEQRPFLTEYSATSIKYKNGLMCGVKLTLGFTF